MLSSTTIGLIDVHNVTVLYFGTLAGYISDTYSRFRIIMFLEQSSSNDLLNLDASASSDTDNMTPSTGHTNALNKNTQISGG